MVHLRSDLSPAALAPKLRRLFELSAAKIRSIEKSWEPARGAPVFTVRGQYTSRGWTEWTQGFQFGAAILQFDATGEREFLEIGRDRAVALMAPHLTHTGVHDHGFNNISTYGNLLRLMAEGRIPENAWERRYYELALKCSGAVQAARWSPASDGGGYIYSFNGPHSLFVDTIRTLRALAVAHLLGHTLMGEGDRRISLLDRLKEHARTTAKYAVYYGEGRDIYDVRGRVAHESIFNTNDGHYRCPNSQQGYSPFSTWTRGLAWAMCGFAEQLEFLDTLPDQRAALEIFEKAARATCDFYIENTRPMAFLIGTRARPAWRSWATGAPKRRTHSMPTSRLIAPRPRLPRRGCCGLATVSTTTATGKPAWRSATRFSTSPTSAPAASTRASFYTRSITGQTDGTPSPTEHAYPRRSLRCGATITRGRWRYTCCAWSRTSRTSSSGREMCQPLPEKL